MTTGFFIFSVRKTRRIIVGTSRIDSYILFQYSTLYTLFLHYLLIIVIVFIYRLRIRYKRFCVTKRIEQLIHIIINFKAFLTKGTSDINEEIFHSDLLCLFYMF